MFINRRIFYFFPRFLQIRLLFSSLLFSSLYFVAKIAKQTEISAAVLSVKTFFPEYTLYTCIAFNLFIPFILSYCCCFSRENPTLQRENKCVLQQLSVSYYTNKRDQKQDRNNAKHWLLTGLTNKSPVFLLPLWNAALLLVDSANKTYLAYFPDC